MTGPTRIQLDQHTARRGRLMQAMGPDGIAIIPSAREVIRARDTHYRFRQDSDFRYLTGFPEPDSIAVLAPGRPEGEYVLFVRPRDATMEIWNGRRAGIEGAKKQFRADQTFVIDDFEKQLPKLIAERARVFYTLGEHPQLDHKITRCVKETRELSRRGPSAPMEFHSLDASLHEMRLHKTPAEIEIIKKACAISAQAHVRAMQFTKPGRTEFEVAAEIHHTFEQHGMEPGYGSIVGAGDNACILHYVENNAQLKSGDLLLIDAGGELNGYTADITRTFPVSGKFSPAQKAVYEVVLAAQKAATAELVVGNPTDAAHKVATRVLTEGMVELGLLKGPAAARIKDESYKRFFMHGTGHWLGLDVHDVGRYKLDNKYRPFAAGMVMTVEPGIYIAPGSEGVDKKFWGIGIRIEDDVLITAKGPQVLTWGVPKEVKEIEALMRG